MARSRDPGGSEPLAAFRDVTQVRQLLALAAATSFCVPEIFMSLDRSNVPSDSLSQTILAPEALQMERIVSPPLPTFDNTSDPVLGPGRPPPPEKPLRSGEQNTEGGGAPGTPAARGGTRGTLGSAPRPPHGDRDRHWPGWLQASSLADPQRARLPLRQERS